MNDGNGQQPHNDTESESQLVAPEVVHDSDDTILSQCQHLFKWVAKVKYNKLCNNLDLTKPPTLPTDISASHPEAALLIDILLSPTLTIYDVVCMTHVIFKGDNPMLLKHILALYAAHCEYVWNHMNDGEQCKELYDIPRFGSMWDEARWEKRAWAKAEAEVQGE
jgi:hypothetical protein